MTHHTSLTLAPWIAKPVVSETEQAVLLHAETTYEVLEGADFVALFKRISSGPKTRRALERELAPPFPRNEIRDMITELVDDHILVEHVSDLTPEEQAAATHLRLPPRLVADGLRTRRVAIQGHDDDAARLAKALRACGIRLAEKPEDASFTIATARHWRDMALLEHNTFALSIRQPWLPVVLGGPVPFVGPIFRPFETASFVDLFLRLYQNDRVGSLLLHNGTPSAGESASRLAATASAMIDVAAWETVRWIVLQHNASLDEQLLAFDGDGWTPTQHAVIPYSERTKRGLPPEPASHPVPPVFQWRKKLEPERSFRTIPLEAAYARLTPFVSPLTGIMRNERLLQAPGRSPIHTCVIEHDATFEVDSLDALYYNEYTTSSGKGATELQARTGARCEALERFLSAWSKDRYVELHSYADLEPKGAYDPNSLLGFSPRQYALREAWNAAHPCPSLFIPDDFDPRAPLHWVPVWSLRDECWRYVPAAFAYMGYPEGDRVYCRGDSNGNASGATLEEAILQAFLELCERDAVSIWFYNRLRRPGVDLASFTEHPYFSELEAYYRETLHRKVHVLDITSDLGFPTFVAISYRYDRQPEDIVMGFGTSPDAVSAIYRALTEMSQSVHALLEEAADGSTRYPADLDSDRLAWYETATVSDNPYLVPDPQTTMVASDYPYTPNDDVLYDMLACMDRAGAAGLDVCVLDLTLEQVAASEMKVVKVIVPGMVHWWRRLGHRRLYEVPVRMGWLTAPLEEADLNPWSITF